MGLNKNVNFNTAKLLKEKGFNLPTMKYHVDENTCVDCLPAKIDGSYPTNDDMIMDWCSAPTIADVIMWLYEKHKIWISSSAIHSPHLRRGDAFFIQLNILDRQNSESIEIKNNVTKGTSFNSPTEAYEAAIKYCLENLIK